jgi:hypothetical protein
MRINQRRERFVTVQLTLLRGMLFSLAGRFGRSKPVVGQQNAIHHWFAEDSFSAFRDPHYVKGVRVG